MTLKEANKAGSLDRIKGIRLSEGRVPYERQNMLWANEYSKGWTDMDTFLRMASIVKEASSKG